MIQHILEEVIAVSASFLKHVHEFQGSTQITEDHNHRFAGVTFEVIKICHGKKHKHRFWTNTDFYEDHHHVVKGFTGPNIPISNGRHIHFVKLRTTLADGHRHVYRLATMINDPIGD